MDEYKWVKHWSFYVAIGLIAVGTWYGCQTKEVNYINVTPITQNTAIDVFEEVPVPYGNTGHKISKKRMTKGRKIDLAGTAY